MSVLVGFRGAVAEVLGAVLDLPVYPVVPEQLNELPCVVVGRPSAGESNTPTVFDVDLDAYLIGPNVEAGGSTSDELDRLADVVLDALGGTFAVESSEGWSLGVTSVEPRSVEVAGTSFPTYLISIESSARTC